MSKLEQELIQFQIGALCDLLNDKLSEVNFTTQTAKDLKDATYNYIKLIEPIVLEIYKNSIYTKYPIMQDVANRFETITRKIYKECLTEINKK